MKHPARAVLVSLILLLGTSDLPARYKSKALQIKSAQEYPSYQDFQNLTIAAYPCETEAKTLEFFDTDKLHEKQIMPVLLVVENRNDFAVRILEKDVLFLDAAGNPASPIPYLEVLLHISLDKPLGAYSTRPEELVEKEVDKDMRIDFETKSFGEKLIGPESSDYGVVFYWLPEEGNLAGTRLYIPEIFNLTEGRELMFFEFDLERTGE